MGLGLLENKKNELLRGVIKKYKADKGYGFVTVATLNKDVFFYKKKWKSKKSPHTGDFVVLKVQQENTDNAKASFIALDNENPANKAMYKKSKMPLPETRKGILLTILASFVLGIVLGAGTNGLKVLWN